MADNHRHPDDLDLEVHHEVHDVNVIAITRFGIALTLTVIVAMAALWGLFTYFKNRVAEEFGEAPPLAGVGVNAAKLPPQPRLQASPRSDLRAMRAAEDQLLNSYAWVEGQVIIPVDRAMDILAQKGLPYRTQAPPPLGSQNNPTQSSAGPILEQPGGPLATQLGRGGAPPQGTH